MNYCDEEDNELRGLFIDTPLAFESFCRYWKLTTKEEIDRELLHWRNKFN